MSCSPGFSMPGRSKAQSDAACSAAASTPPRERLLGHEIALRPGDVRRGLRPRHRGQFRQGVDLGGGLLGMHDDAADPLAEHGLHDRARVGILDPHHLQRGVDLVGRDARPQIGELLRLDGLDGPFGGEDAVAGEHRLHAARDHAALRLEGVSGDRQRGRRQEGQQGQGSEHRDLQQGQGLP